MLTLLIAATISGNNLLIQLLIDTQARAIISALKASEQRIKNYTVTIRYEDKALQLNDLATHQYSKYSVSSTHDFRGRFRYTLQGYYGAKANEVKATMRVVGSYDGEVYKEESWHPVLGTSGTIAKDSMSLSWYVDPSDLFWEYGGDPVSSLLMELGVGSVNYDEKHIVLITKPSKSDAEDMKGIEAAIRFVINPEMGFAVIKKQMMQRREGEEWVVYAEVRGSDYRQIAQNIWTPGLVRQFHWFVNQGPKKILITDKSAFVEEMTVNQDIEDNLFTFSFQDCSELQDKRSGKTLIAVSESKATPEQIALDGEKFYIQEEYDNKAFRTWLIVGIAAGVILLVALYFIVRRIRRSTKHGVV